MSVVKLARNLQFIAIVLLCPIPLAADSVDQFQDSARLYVEAGDFRAALIELKNAQQADPNNFSTPFLLSQIYAQMGRYDEAEHAIELAKTKGLSRKFYVIWLWEFFLAKEKNREILNQLTVQANDSPEIRGEILALRTQAELNLGQIKEGTIKFQQALELSPKSHTANWALARKAFELGDDVSAERHLTMLLDSFPNDSGAQFIRAQLYEKRGSIKAARLQYSKILRTHPQNIEARLRRAALLLADEEFNRAQEDINWLLEREPTLLPAKILQAQWLWSAQQYDLAEQQLKEILSVEPNQLSALELLGRVAMAKDNHQQATQHFKHYLELEPNNLEISMLYANVQLLLGCSSCAVSTLTQVQSSNHGNTDLMTLLGLAYIESGEQKKGLHLLEKASFLQPYDENAKIRNTIQSIYSGQIEQALEQARYSAAADSLQSGYITVLSLLTAGYSDDAVVEAERLFARYPSEPFAANLLGLVKLYQGDVDAASERFNHALSMQADYLPALLNLAEVKRQQRDFDEAERLYRKASKKVPLDKQLLLTQARFYLYSGNNSKALQTAQQAWELNPQDLAAGFMTMRVHLTMGDPSAAQRIAEQLLNLNADGLSLRRRIGDVFLEYEHWSLALDYYQGLGGALSPGVGVTESIVYALYQQQQYQQAWSQLQSIAEDSLRPRTLIVAVDLAMRRAKPDLALAFAYRLQQLAPNEAVGYHLAAKIYTHQNRFGLAAENYEIAYVREPADEILIQASRASLRAGQPKKAITLLTDALTINEPNTDIRLALATLYHRLGQSTLAIAEYERLLDESSGSEVQIHNNLAYLYLDTDLQKALKHAKSAYHWRLRMLRWWIRMGGCFCRTTN